MLDNIQAAAETSIAPWEDSAPPLSQVVAPAAAPAPAAPLTGDGRSADTLPGLLAHHVAALRARGITDEMILAAGLRSETDPRKLAILLNRKKVHRTCAPALVIPYRDEAGTVVYHRVRPDIPQKTGGKVAKYLTPIGQATRPYFPPGCREKLAHPDAECIITEGELKALAGMRMAATIGIAGVENWHPKGKTTLLPEIAHVGWKGRPTFVAFDSDIETKPEVKTAESLLGADLIRQMAAAKALRIPPGPDGAKQGLDDYMAANGLGPLRKLMDDAQPPEPPEGGEAKLEASKIDPATEALAILKEDMEDGLYRIRYWRGTFWQWSRGRYAELHKDDAEGAVIRCLNRDYCKLGNQTAYVIKQLKAQAAIPFRTEPPTWLRQSQGGDWPADEILAAQNAIVHLPSLATGKPCTLPPTPRLFVTSALDYRWSADAAEPVAWLNFLRELWGDDDESISTLQDWFGLSLTPNTRLQKILLLIGPKRSGKGTLMRVLRAVVGKENCAGPLLAGLATNFGLWPLLGKSLAIINDARLSGRSDQAIVVERLLSISGEDDLTVDRKHLEPVTCKIPARLVIVSNELPRLQDSSGALTGRMVVLQLTQSFFGREDATLTDKLLAELPAILNWAIAGWLRLRERGHFVQPKAASELAEEMGDLASPVGMFLRERCRTECGCTVPAKLLFKAWEDWCHDKGRKEAGTEQTFGRDLRAAVSGIKVKQPREGDVRYRVYEGVGLLPGN